MDPVALLVNPTAARGRAVAIGQRVERRLREHGLDVTRVPAAAEATGADVLVVEGGDGTVHRALPALAGTPTALAVVPAGSGNDLAADLGIPADPMAAADLVVTGRIRRIDLGVVGDQPFATVLCTGFDSEVAARANRMRWPRGPRRYDVAVLAEVARLRPVPLTLEVDGVRSEHLVTLVAVGNTRLYGGGLRICPDADPSDGRLDVTVVGPMSRRELLRVAPRLRSGTHVDHPAVRRYRAAVVALSGAGLTAYADGEPLGALPLAVSIRPGALAVVTPL